MVDPQIHLDKAAHARLARMGLDWEVFEGAFKYGLNEAETCTGSDAGFCKGVLLYSRLGRRLQETLRDFDWEGGRPHNQQCVWSYRTGVRILHVTGNAETANPDPKAHAGPERPGGSARKELVLRNAKASLFDALPEDSGFKDIKTWFLLYRAGDRTLRSELSYTETLSDDGAGIPWTERIILPEVPLPDGVQPGDDLWD